jgi:molecular chaperone GrpE
MRQNENVMAKNKDTKNVEQLDEKELMDTAATQTEDVTADQTEQQEENTPSETEQLQAKVAELEARVAELEDLKLRQMAEFDNFRRRTNKEKLDLITTAGERIFCDMLPLVDDFERAKVAMAKSEDINAVRDGIDLIYNKFVAFLAANNVKAIDTTDADFNTDLHEAITTFAAGEDKKGKVIDCTQTGYTLGEKVIRFAKVVVGE